MRVRYLAGCLWAISLLACGRIGREPSPAPTVAPISISQARVVYYDISGATEAELREQMDALGPVDPSGRRADALTAWTIEWQWPGNPDGTCRLTDVEVTYTITVTFPRWAPPAEAPPELVAKWNEFTLALAAHEQEHVDNVVVHVPAVVQAVEHADCDTANAAAESVLESIRRYDADYDRETNHGATQGARFP